MVAFNAVVLSPAMISSIAAFSSSPSVNFFSAVVIAASVLIVVPPSFTVTPASSTASKNSLAYSFKFVKSAPLSIIAPSESTLLLNIYEASCNFSASDSFIKSSK